MTAEDAPTLPLDLTAAGNISRASWDDAELNVVRDYLISADPDGKRFAKVLRATIDQLLDGENTGRYDWQDLHKTEKTHAGTLVEINLQREFGFAEGQDMDFAISGIDVDCKFSQKTYGWMIPPEALDELCLVVWADDHKSMWSAGLFRASRDKLTSHGGKTRKGNRDGKFQLTKSHHSMVCWLWEQEPLQENLLLHIDVKTRDSIYAAGNASNRFSGQARVRALFQKVQQRKVSRTVIRTLGQQSDYMRRVRYNGGARDQLRKHGIVIFGDFSPHQRAAADLRIPVPAEGEFVSVRVARADPHDPDRPRTVLDGEEWVVARPDDPVVMAPLVPETKKASRN